ncbi:hypothetical protein QKU48_gp1219 [Fadolivirus algeromassiliense]|jgi:hypothetical protein|uniref:Uncharacterized protein n=1 Tax=Fadolivirus FV1/VV64 TaxID=3070911 RepID=A0A7D3V963_9VIRU|nr:hypothetical protein QKU48_gp1219 [Fadolivirus algeromassiliense]QKF94677.1 hypothetical protein Fadolivirus_1_1219 [Fadolivirus FV1/VV64]
MKFTTKDALYFIKKVKLDMSDKLFTIDDLTKGMNVELEHGTRDIFTNVTGNDLITTGKIALAHLIEFPDYYRRLDLLEKDADKYWKNKPKTRPKRYKLVR